MYIITERNDAITYFDKLIFGWKLTQTVFTQSRYQRKLRSSRTETVISVSFCRQSTLGCHWRSTNWREWGLQPATPTHSGTRWRKSRYTGATSFLTFNMVIVPNITKWPAVTAWRECNGHSLKITLRRKCCEWTPLNKGATKQCARFRQKKLLFFVFRATSNFW